MSKFDEIKIPENIKFETKKTIQKGKILKKKNKIKYIIAIVAAFFITPTSILLPNAVTSSRL